jgi:hypothetical protein
MVELSNEIAADPWFTLPHQATDAYMRAFATYVRDHLDHRRKAYAEYSNEVWNWIFGQAHWAQAQAVQRWGAEAGGDAWMQYAGMRAAQMAAIWEEVFGAEAERRLIRVVGTQTGWLGLSQPLLEAPLWVAEDPGRNRQPAAYFDAYAVTGYFGNLLGSEKAPDVLRWLDEGHTSALEAARSRGLNGPALNAVVERHRLDLATERAAEELRVGSATGRPDDSIAAVVDLWAALASIAARYDLALVMYEGATNFPLLAIPLFIFAGAIMNASSISRRLIALCLALVGFIRGALAIVTVGVNMFYAEISGSAVADVAATGTILIPAMKKRGYPKAFAAAVCSSAATLAIIIPPSIPMIIYGAMAPPRYLLDAPREP